MGGVRVGSVGQSDTRRDDEGFRFALTAFLATIDVLIGLLLVYEYSYPGAVVFLLAPPLI
jgi:hypothetical protein